MRICSLLPSATEIVYALGLGASLVAATHECDFPPEVARVPKVTRSLIPANATGGQIDSLVSSTLESQGSIYELDLPLLESLRPELILTQRLCDVCAVSFDRVERAAGSLSSQPRVLNLEPHSLEDIFQDIWSVARETGTEAAAENLVGSLRARAAAIREASRDLPRPRVLCMEWVDPPYCGGHWMKELVEIAGGHDDLAVLHRPSRRIEWQRVVDFAPEVLVLTCCGFDLERCEREGAVLASFEGSSSMPAVRKGRVFATDANQFFSRPGPRIVESLEILAHLVHPEIFPAPDLLNAFHPLDLLSLRSTPAIL
jgi:iron complex transport system substrate-binding protein